MSPQDSVERVLKEIHITFSKAETYNGEPNKMIVDRKEFLELLDRLNRSIFDMLEQYEQTRQSRDNAERAFRRKGEEIIEDANASAEQIYAASMMYTEDAIDRLRRMMDATAESMNDLFRTFRRELREQKDTLNDHGVEIHSQLSELADSQRYLSILQQINEEKNRKERDLAAERLAGERYRTSMVNPAAHRPKNPNIEVKVNKDSRYFKKHGGYVEEAAEEEVKVAAPVEMKAEEEKEEVRKAGRLRRRKDKEKEEPEVLDLDMEEDDDMSAFSSAIAKMLDENPDEYLEGGSNPVPELTAEEEELLEQEQREAYEQEKKEHLAELQSEIDDLEIRVKSEKKAKSGPGAGQVLKNLVFGKDEV